MAPAIAAGAVLSSVRAGSGNAARFPARARRCPVDRQVQAPRKASARPGGGEAPAGGGAGAGRGLWPPAGQEPAWRCGRGDGPCYCSGEGAFVSAGGIRKRSAFPRPRATVPADRQFRDKRKASARRGRGGRWPGALAPGWTRISVVLWQGRWPLPLKRWQCFRQWGRHPETRPAFPPPLRDGSLKTGRSANSRRPAPAEVWGRAGDTGGVWPGR